MSNPPKKPTEPKIHVPQEYLIKENPVLCSFCNLKDNKLTSFLDQLKEFVDINDPEAMKTICIAWDEYEITISDEKSRQVPNPNYAKQLNWYQQNLPHHEQKMKKYEEELAKWKIEQEAYLKSQLDELAKI